MSKNIKVYYNTEEVTPRWGKMSVDEDVNTSVQKQLLQLSQIMETHLKSTLSPPSMYRATEFKNIKAPEGRYDMTASEFRTYTKDCQDYKSLTNCEDKQLVIQMRYTHENLSNENQNETQSVEKAESNNQDEC